MILANKLKITNSSELARAKEKDQQNKSNLRFVPVMYLNVAHPFYEWKGQSMCIWLDAILKKS